MSEEAAIYLVDGDGGSRRRLARQLGERGIDVWPFGTGAALLRIVDKLRPSCILLDIRIDGGRGIDLIARLQARGKAWPVIALDADANVASAVAAMRQGAVDFLRKPADQGLLDRALSAAWARLRQGVEADDAIEEARVLLARLTPREEEVAAALLEGLSNKRAAHLLGISVRTVEMHRAHLMFKLGARNMAEAAVHLARAGFPGAPAPLTARELLSRGNSSSHHFTVAA
jgi:two-component system, LuxR family, response regulator FixJ